MSVISKDSHRYWLLYGPINQQNNELAITFLLSMMGTATVEQGCPCRLQIETRDDLKTYLLQAAPDNCNRRFAINI